MPLGHLAVAQNEQPGDCRFGPCFHLPGFQKWVQMFDPQPFLVSNAAHFLFEWGRFCIGNQSGLPGTLFWRKFGCLQMYLLTNYTVFSVVTPWYWYGEMRMSQDSAPLHVTSVPFGFFLKPSDMRSCPSRVFKGIK